MPCSEYKGKQRALCFATDGWSDWTQVKISDKHKSGNIGRIDLKVKTKTEITKSKGGKIKNGI